MKKRKVNYKLLGLIVACFVFGLGAGSFIASSNTTCVCQLPLELFSQ